MTTAAPSSNILRYALVRPPKLEAFRSARSRVINVTSTDKISFEKSNGNIIEPEDILRTLLAQLSDDVNQEILTNARDFRRDARIFSVSEEITKEAWSAFSENRKSSSDLSALQGVLADIYTLSISLDRYEVVSMAEDAIRDLNSLIVLGEKSEEDVLVILRKIIDPIVAIDSPAKTPPTKGNDPDTRLEQRAMEELLLFAIAHKIIDLARVNGQLEWREDESTDNIEQFASEAGESVFVSHGARTGRLTLGAQGSAAFPDDLAHFMRDYFKVEDLASADIELLNARILNELQSRLAAVFPSLSVREILFFSRTLQRISESYRTKAITDLNEQVMHLKGLLNLADLTTGIYRGTDPGKVRPCGIADLKVVRQQLQKYERGEIAHIENVLKGERRLRKHHRGEKIEQTYTVEEEQTTTNEKDLQTTERFELSQELQSVIEEKQKTDSNLKVSATYGVISLAAQAGMSNEQSVEESSRTARTYARETISKASERIERRVRKQSTVVTLFETSEDNEHEFNASTDSVVGIYRWVEKHYFCQTFNYGARLMFEVSIPEPAAYYLYAQESRPNGDSDFRPPEPPNFSAADITELTYLALAAKYGASVSAAPASLRTSNIAILQGAGDPDKDAGKVSIGSGWEVIMASPIAACRVLPNFSYYVLISPNLWSSADGTWSTRYFQPGIRDEFQIGFNGLNIQHFSVSVNLVLARTAEAYSAWQLSTYNSIVEAYQARKSEYDRKAATLQARRPSVAIRTDTEYREIERNELKRASIHLIAGVDLSGFGAISHPPGKPPVMDPDRAILEGQFVSLIENGFEWNEMAYEFFPYFWGSNQGWVNTFAASDQDAAFQRFLRAGSGRTVLPVRRGMERQILYYLETGKVWMGNDPPVINDPVYLAFIEELSELNEDAPQDPVPEGSPWKQTVPTSLVCLEGQTLPSWEISAPNNGGVFLPSTRLCNGIPYNQAQWPPDQKSVVEALGELGFQVGNPKDAIVYLKSLPGKRVVRAFQLQANKVGASARIGRALGIDGDMGPCSLRVLTIALAMLRSGQWPSPI